MFERALNALVNSCIFQWIMFCLFASFTEIANFIAKTRQHAILPVFMSIVSLLTEQPYFYNKNDIICLLEIQAVTLNFTIYFGQDINQ